MMKLAGFFAHMSSRRGQMHQMHQMHLMKLMMRFIPAVACLGVVACSPPSPKQVPLPAVKKEKVKNVGEKVTFNPRVDILFVVDDSGSMSSHQKNLSTNIQLFTNGIQNNQLLNYHIGVITTSMDSWSTGKGGSGKLVGTPAFVQRSTPNGINRLATNLLVGTSGSGEEKFFEPVRAALTAPLINTANAGFYRQDAHLAVIFITDTDDQSDGISPEDYHQFLIDLKGGDKGKILSYGVFIPSTDGSCDRSGEEEPERIERYMWIANGISFGLCDSDYGQKLADLSDDLVQKVGKTMYLTRPPDPATIEVRYGTQIIPNHSRLGWVFDPAKNALIFGSDIQYSNQPPGTQLEVNFVAAQYD